MINRYDDFIEALFEAGFTAGSRADNVYSIYTFELDNPEIGPDVRWFTGDPETDPWEWHKRIVNERRDIAYAKFFFGKSGFITKPWYPYFLAARRAWGGFDEAYGSGLISGNAKREYDVLRENGPLPVHMLKSLSGFASKEESKFRKALTELQARMYITVCGSVRKISKKGEEYGWDVNVYSTTEDFFGESVFNEAAGITSEEATDKIAARIYELNPAADKKKVLKFITG